MSIVVVGSVAFDTIASPSGKVEDVLGGAATYFALAASYFTPVRVVAVVGGDFTADHENVLKKRGVDTRGIEHATGKTFRWGGQYHDNLNEAKTDFTELNVFEQFQPRMPAEYLDSKFLFLANIHPDLQAQVRRNMKGTPLTGGDTMNYWINRTRGELLETLKVVDVLLINDTEAKALGGETNLPRAAQKVLALGPGFGEELALGFVGDVGDLVKLISAENGKRKILNSRAMLEHELADCLWSVIVLSQTHGVDLEKSFSIRWTALKSIYWKISHRVILTYN